MADTNNTNPFANLYDNEAPEEPTTKVPASEDENLNFDNFDTPQTAPTTETKAQTPTHNDFEHEIDTLSKIVTELGQGDLPLNDAIDKFNDGMQLSGKLQKSLEQANAKVAKIIDDNDQLSNL